MRSTEAAKKLEQVAQRLQQRGEAELAREVDEVIVALRKQVVGEPTGALMTTGEAAEALGVRSVNTIKRWAREGILEGYRRGGRVMVTRESVTRMLLNPALDEQKEQEACLAEDLDPFDVGERRVPPTRWPGRKPWERNAGSRT
ncbi:MAG: helix-turn-helix domain-containing protein [Chloroflexi bacterium]|nr:helix-turn-helix domain-containing protein [Chloroflexota bacterium]